MDVCIVFFVKITCMYYLRSLNDHMYANIQIHQNTLSHQGWHHHGEVIKGMTYLCYCMVEMYV